MRISLAVFLLFLLTGCTIFQSEDEKTVPDEQQAVSQMYQEAKSLLEKGSYDLAIQKYEKLQSRFPYGEYSQHALLESAYAHYKLDESEAGLSTISRYIKLYPDSEFIDYAYYLRGLINFNLNDSFINRLGGFDPTERDPAAARRSFKAFGDLVKRFPDSKYAPDARLRMQYLVNSLAEYELHVAQYYLRRGAHIAAANRAKTVLSRFPKSPAVLDALKILVEAYDQLGMEKLRDDAQRVLQANLKKNPSVAAQSSADSVQSDDQWWQFWK